MKSLRAAVAVLALLSACTGLRPSTTPASEATGPYLATKFCGFNFDGRTKQARLTIDLTVLRPLPPGAVVEVQFENPLEPGQTLTSTYRVQGGEREVRVLSPPVKGIEQKEYAMTVRAYSAADKSTLLGMHRESCRSPVSQRELGTEYQ